MNVREKVVLRIRLDQRGARSRLVDALDAESRRA
jgi:hypothetical protein